jgi:hypothetical protein
VWVASYTMFYGCVERPEIASPAVMSWIHRGHQEWSSTSEAGLRAGTRGTDRA